MRLATIKDFYQDINYYVFDEKLVMPFIGFCRWNDALGEYHGRGERAPRMRFSRTLSLELAMPVIFHEMIHQYQYEYLNLSPDHGVTFWAFEKFAKGMDWTFGEEL